MTADKPGLNVFAKDHLHGYATGILPPLPKPFKASFYLDT